MSIKLESKPAYSLIFAFVIMTVLMLIASTTVKNTTGKLAYYRDIEGSPMAKLAAESAAENGIMAMKDFNAGYEASEDYAYCYREDGTKNNSGDGDCETWGNYEVFSKAQELDSATGTHTWYTPIPGSGTAGDPDHCSITTTDENKDHPCNWNKLLFGDTITIPLYSDDGSGISNPVALGFNNWKLRVRTPCADGDLDNASCTRIVIDTHDSTGTFTTGTTAGDSVIFWQLVGENAAGTVSLVPNDEPQTLHGTTSRHPSYNTEIYESLINTGYSGTGYDHTVLQAINAAPFTGIYGKCTDSTLTGLSLQLNIVTPLKDYYGDPIPYLEWQLVTDSTEPFGDTKAIIEGKGYHQGLDHIFYSVSTIIRSTTGENMGLYTVSN